MTGGASDLRKSVTPSAVYAELGDFLRRHNLDAKRLLIIIPDGTRTAPLPLFFRAFHKLLAGRVKQLDYLVALGTHQPMDGKALNKLVGVRPAEWKRKYAGVRVFNHRWSQPAALKLVGTIPSEEISRLSGGLLSMPVEVRLNKLVFDYDQIIICGPVFPHEVVGFSGGNKYFFPGIAGPEIINFTHWLGALITSYRIIGTKPTPVRAVIDRAAEFITTPALCVAFVMEGHRLAGVFCGPPREAWSQAADLSAKVNVRYVERPYHTVVSVMPRMYDDIWTAAKGMYKLEPVVADGGEVVIYAPHIREISYTHGAILDRIGYHCRDYFVKQWERFKDYPWGVLAHSTHLAGLGAYEDGIERLRIKVTLATRIPEERCRKVNLGYRDPRSIRLSDYRGREKDGVLLVPKAGELLYRLKA